MPEKNELKVNHSELLTLLTAHELQGNTSAEFGKLVTVTEPKTLKKSRVTGLPLPYSKVTKETEALCMFNAIYENAVNNQLVRDGVQEKGENNFVAGALPWGQWLQYEGGKRSKLLIEHKEEFYIRATFNTQAIPVVTYRDQDGNVIPKASLVDYLPERDDEIVAVRTIKISSIRKVHINRNIYTVV